MKITLDMIYQICLSDEAVIVAGKKGLSRSITRITVAELPDATEWLREGELVCSTGFFLVNNEEMQRGWIRKMTEIGCAGMIIKPSRFLGDIPVPMIQEADACGLPILTMPMETRWPLVIEKVMDTIISIQNENLNLLNQANKTLTKMLFELKSPQGIAEEISRQSGCPVIMIDPFLEKESIMLDVDEHRGIIDAMMESDSFVETVESLRDTDTSGDLVSKSIQLTGYGVFDIYIMPIAADVHFFGWIIVVDVGAKTDFLSLFITQSSVVLALSYLNRYAPLLTEYRNNARIIEMISGRVDAMEGAMKEIYKLLASNSREKLRIIIIHPKKQILPLIIHHIQDRIVPYEKKAITIQDENMLVIFLHSPASLPEADSLRNCLQIIDSQTKYWNSLFQGFNVGVSNTIDKSDNLKKAYKEAELCLKKAIREDRQVVSYEDMGMDKLFCQIEDTEGIYSMSMELLKPLMQQDSDGHSQLVHTFHTYLKNEKNITSTSRVLNIHQNTLRYRLERITNLLNIDLSDSEISMLYYFALETYERRKE